MRRGAAWILVFLMLFSTACADTNQKAPDYYMEGFDGTTYRVWESNLFFARMQEKTGISFQFQQYTDETQWAMRKEEILEGTNLPDVLFKAELSSAEVRDLYQNGYIIDLRPYLETYAPDLWKLLQKHPEWEKAISMPDGAIPALPAINMLQNNDAMWINTVWLKKLKLDMPTTAEELTETLRAFKTQDPNGNMQQDEIPLAFLGMWELRFLAHAFGIIDNDYYVTVKDGTVTSSLTSDENRAFLTWLHLLWTEGLLDPNGFIHTDNMRQITDEKATVPYGMIMAATPVTILPQAAADQFSILEPMYYDGKRIYRDLTGDLIRGTFAITSACREPEKLVAWVNTLYTEEGSRLAFYGTEGDEYIWTDDGLWEWSTTMQAVADEIIPAHTISEGGTAPGYEDAAFQMKYREESARRAVNAMYNLKQYSILPYPFVTLDAEAEKRVAEIQPDLSAYAETTMARFVTGDIELTDENWELFCKTVEEKGLSEMIEIWQKAIK